MDKHLRHLTPEELSPMPLMLNYLNSDTVTEWQKLNTCKFMNLNTHCFLQSDKVLIVPSSLHIKLGLMNKIVDSLDQVVKFLSSSMIWILLRMMSTKSILQIVYQALGVAEKAIIVVKYQALGAPI